MLIFRELAMLISGFASRTMKSALLPGATIPVLKCPAMAESRVAATIASDGVSPMSVAVRETGISVTTVFSTTCDCRAF